MGAQEGAPNGQSWKLLILSSSQALAGGSWLLPVSLLWSEEQRDVPIPVKVIVSL